jgi:hypothetical protein
MRKITYKYLFIFVLLYGCNLTPEPEHLYSYRNVSEVYFVNADGTDFKKITNDKEFVYCADFIPLSSKIYYVISFGDELKQTMVTLDLKTGIRDTICEINTFISRSRLNYPKWKRIDIAKDGKKIYVTSAPPLFPYNKALDILSIDLETKQITNITNNALTSVVNEISLSNDGNTIIYTETDQHWIPFSVNTINLVTGQKQNIFSRTSDGCYYPQIMPDNATAFFVEKNGDGPTILNYHTIPLDSGRTSTIISPSYAGDHYYPSLSKYGSVLLADDTPGKKYGVLNLPSGVISRSEIPVTSVPFLSFDKNNWLYFSNNSTIKIFDAETGTISKTINIPLLNGNNSIPRMSNSNGDIIFLNIQSISEPR